MSEKRPYKVVLESMTQEKKKLRSTVTYTETAPCGYTFVPIGVPDLADYCKELSRKRGVDVGIVSAKPKSFAHTNPNHVSHHIHRIGYHFRNDIVDTACTQLDFNAPRRGRPQRGAQQTLAPTAIARRMETYGSQLGLDSTNQDSNREMQTASLAIRDLFPKIPETDQQAIITRAFQQGSDRVGTQETIPLPRRVQLAVLAHVRHTKTDYDSLLKTVGWHDARRAVEQACLDQIVRWRGEDNEGDGELEDIFQEVIIIDDESDGETDQQQPREKESSVEIISDQLNADDVDDYSPSPPNVGRQPLRANPSRPDIISVKPLRASRPPPLITQEAYQKRLHSTQVRVRNASISQPHGFQHQEVPRTQDQRHAALTYPKHGLGNNPAPYGASLASPQRIGNHAEDDGGLPPSSRPFYVASSPLTERIPPQVAHRPQRRHPGNGIRPSIEAPDQVMTDAPQHLPGLSISTPNVKKQGPAVDHDLSSRRHDIHSQYVGHSRYSKNQPPHDEGSSRPAPRKRLPYDHDPQPASTAVESRGTQRGHMQEPQAPHFTNQVVDLTESSPPNQQREPRYYPPPHRHPYHRPTSLAARRQPSPEPEIIPVRTLREVPAPAPPDRHTGRRPDPADAQADWHYHPSSRASARLNPTPLQRFYELDGHGYTYTDDGPTTTRQQYQEQRVSHAPLRPDVQGYGQSYPDVRGYDSSSRMDVDPPSFQARPQLRGGLYQGQLPTYRERAWGDGASSRHVPGMYDDTAHSWRRGYDYD